MLDVIDKAIKSHPNDAINMVFDSLSDLILSIGLEKTYHFTKYALEIMALQRMTALFLLNGAAHDTEAVHSLRSLFSNQIAFGKAGIQSVKLPKIEIEGIEIEKIPTKSEILRKKR